jgi:hypothetical protein
LGRHESAVAASEVAVDAERRVGELLREQAEKVERSRGGRPKLIQKMNSFSKPTLEDQGILPKESMKYQKLAAISDEKFEQIMADRIQARAIRRCGELLKEIEAAKNQYAYTAGGISRSQAAKQAGLSCRQKVTALRVANLPQESFEQQVESDDPPTVTVRFRRELEA